MLPVIFSEITTKNNKRIALAELNAPQTLNALNMSMFELLHKQLLQWQCNDDIAMVIIQGAGDKAFCAGGDVVSLYHALKSERDSSVSSQSNISIETAGEIIDDQKISTSLAHEFFSLEYQVDQLIHQFTKPVLVWGNGYIMGGGIGLFAGASHKVVTEKTLLAMPEVTIGLYPDVGASWLLNKAPKNIGIFLGMTGAIFNAVDAINIGLANYAISSHFKNDVMTILGEVFWGNNDENYALLDKALVKHAQQSEQVFKLMQSNVSEHQAIITQLTNFDNSRTIYQAILALETESDWLQRAQEKLRKGSPLSAMITYQQLMLSKNFTLAQCFASELNLSLRCCQYPEFSEGVRALLVDKDKKPRWCYDNIDDIPAELLTWFFTPIEHLDK